MELRKQHDNRNLAPDIPDEWFVPKAKDEDAAEAVVRPSLSYWQDAWRRLLKTNWQWQGYSFLLL